MMIDDELLMIINVQLSKINDWWLMVANEQWSMIEKIHF